MRFFEYEARESSGEPGSPSPTSASPRRADEAREIAAEIGGPVVLKSQVLTGGRMKAGGVKFADTPDEAEDAAEAILAARDQRAASRAACSSSSARRSRRSTSPASPGTAGGSCPVMIFSDMGGIDIEEVAEKHPEHVVAHALLDARAVQRLQAPRRRSRATGVTRRRPQQADADRRDAGRDLPRATT